MNKFVYFGAFGVTLLLGSSLTTQSFAQEEMTVAPITVEAPMLALPATRLYDAKNAATAAPYADAAEYLKSVAGITAGRFGGHGLEPFIRGQSESQLNIVDNGTYITGACSSRMDPPTAYLNFKPYDTLKVVKGYQSVLNGFGGTGGSVIVEQGKPEFGSDFSYEGDVYGGYGSNANTREIGANVSAGTDKGYALAYTSYKDADDYEDGNGNDVRSAYTDEVAGMRVGYTGEKSHLYFGTEYQKISDALFAGSMDSPLSKKVTYKAGLEQEVDGNILKNFSFSTYASLVDHVMDNYSLRPLTGMTMRMDTMADTYGAKLAGDLLFSGQLVEAMTEWRRMTREFDVTIDEAALAGETTYDLDDINRLVIGGRYDLVHVNYERPDSTTRSSGAFTANQLYNQFYGITASDTTEHNFGGLMRYEHDLNDDTMVYTGLSRSVRTADILERGLAAYMGMGGSSSRIGNPDLSPEKHYQFDVGFDVQKQSWSYGATAYANFVDDYILRDSARTQEGILVNLPNADVYRNIDAFLTGVTAEGEWQFAPRWTLHGDATYTYGQDVDANRALPQIPPLQGKIGLEWQATDNLELTSTMNWALKQSRVDTDPTDGTGRDVGQTNGYATFDIGGTVTEFEPVSLNFGVTNIFDKTYANHLNRLNAYDPTEVQVNEPGRSFYVQLRMPF